MFFCAHPVYNSQTDRLHYCQMTCMISTSYANLYRKISEELVTSHTPSNAYIFRLLFRNKDLVILQHNYPFLCLISANIPDTVSFPDLPSQIRAVAILVIVSI
jgi:hypothetical protein